ncbi:sex comb on [Parelaphostrongylus tenuis]|uniref:Sex comb on n=1 Tax=Parelaphostrongylus tenuis TaxID=148309 RepID=A0AAD5QH67_PARTN|nr:sex comb on [Parelaphostrongylus tenuis]
MADIVPEAEEFGHDVPMDPTMESEDSEHSEELVMSEPPDSECHMDDVGDNEDATERFNDFAEPTALRNKHEEGTSRSPSSLTLSKFDWTSYLREQKAEPAPKECFFQPDTPPENKFQIGTKLMIADPRGPSGSSAMFCLGTVVNVYKLWLCVRLEGLDNSHEKWIFCDDDSIQPIGPTTEDQMKLNPPIGFIHHHGTFPKFLEQHLKPDDKTGKSMLCPPDWFKPISETLKPVRNFFSVGQKVEAIDQRSFNGKTCPATIAGVTKSHIQIHFDGWNSGYDIKEPYFTRFRDAGWMVTEERRRYQSTKIRSKKHKSTSIDECLEAAIVKSKAQQAPIDGGDDQIDATDVIRWQLWGQQSIVLLIDVKSRSAPLRHGSESSRRSTSTQ